MSSNDWSRARPIATTRTNATAAAAVMITVSWSSCFVSGVFSSSTLLSMPEMRPTSEFIPVAVTTISPRPRVTVEFINAISRRSPRGTSAWSIAVVSFSTGALSPVSPASSI